MYVYRIGSSTVKWMISAKATLHLHIFHISELLFPQLPLFSGMDRYSYISLPTCISLFFQYTLQTKIDAKNIDIEIVESTLVESRMFLQIGQTLVIYSGLRDQILALEWVQDHIHNFGGDKSRENQILKNQPKNQKRLNISNKEVHQKCCFRAGFVKMVSSVYTILLTIFISPCVHRQLRKPFSGNKRQLTSA